MFGYLTWQEEGRPSVSLVQRQIGETAFLVLEAQGNPRRLRRRVRRAMEEMTRRGVRRCVVEESWPEVWRTQLALVEEYPLRRTLLPLLLERLCRQRRIALAEEAALLCAPGVDEAVWAAAQTLAQRSRYLVLAVDGGEALRQHLWRQYGLSPVITQRPALQVCFGEPMLPAPAILLGPSCQHHQRIIYRLSPTWQERLTPWPVSAQLVSALWESGTLPAKEIRVSAVEEGEAR